MEAMFERHLGLLDHAAQKKLQEAKVAVYGCGGLGGYVVELLARVGVGSLLLFDPDVFTESNLNRQLYATRQTLGQSKSAEAAKRVRLIRPQCEAVAVSSDFRAVERGGLDGVDIAMDCLDSIKARMDLAQLCTQCQVPLVHGAVYGWYGQVGIKKPGDDLFERLYPSAHGQQQETARVVPVFSFTVACIASIQAAETVKLILGEPSLLHNQFVHIDLQEGEWISLQEKG